MPRIKKKGTAGSAKNYITRTQAVRKLQISLPDFRRLCIFKGIYPREPRNKKKAAKNSTAATTFYYAKDIQYLLHEPLLAKFRDHKALAKKITRALGRNEVGDAQRLERNHAPRISLDHIIKDRYPTFVDALRDLDDALSMLFLFASLPQTEAVPHKTIALCKRLCHEFEHYLIRSHALRKSFLSIKGIYYQATIQGQDILWLVPYSFVQHVAPEIDFRIMGTFVDFYTTLLGFVNYRLYTTIGLVYPPIFDKESDAQGAELSAFTLQGRAIGDADGTLTNGHDTDAIEEDADATEADTNAIAQIEADKLASVQDVETNAQVEAPQDEIDTFPEPIDPTSDVLQQPSISADTAASLFEPFTFYLSRETPRHPLEFILRAFGCRRVGWPSSLGDGAYTENEGDRRITHQVVDRPNLPATQPSETVGPGQRVPGRTYIQPQWVWDCINAGKLLRPDLYAPGAVLPPHLSPWVKPTKGEYDPTKTVAEQEAEDEAAAAGADSESEDESRDQAVEAIEAADEGVDGMDVELADSASESESEEAIAENDNEEWGGLDESEDEPEEALQRQREIAAEARGSTAPTQVKKSASVEAVKRINKRQREQQEEVDRQKMMMSRRKRQLFEKMQHGNNKRSAEAEKLRAKRRKLESAAK